MSTCPQRNRSEPNAKCCNSTRRRGRCRARRQSTRPTASPPSPARPPRRRTTDTRFPLVADPAGPTRSNPGTAVTLHRSRESPADFQLPIFCVPCRGHLYFVISFRWQNLYRRDAPSGHLLGFAPGKLATSDCAPTAQDLTCRPARRLAQPRTNRWTRMITQRCTTELDGRDDAVGVDRVLFTHGQRDHAVSGLVRNSRCESGPRCRVAEAAAFGIEYVLGRACGAVCIPPGTKALTPIYRCLSLRTGSRPRIAGWSADDFPSAITE